jgi:3-hydroxyacyl-CoA dehydrogenase/enoyl-CoA hydratase/3-hydroxybutyryl-CoA epimerase
MVMEGVNPVLIESAARDNGSPVGPLAAIDEVSQETAHKNGQQMKADALAQGNEFPETAPAILIDKMVNEFGRKGKRYGAGYYDYPESGRKQMWPGLREAFAPDGYKELPYQDIKDRLTFCQCLEAVRAMEDGVLTSVADGNIGSIMGIGFPAQTGGVFQNINAYGLQAFVDRSRELAEKYGEVFEPPQLLVNRAISNELFV